VQTVSGVLTRCGPCDKIINVVVVAGLVGPIASINICQVSCIDEQSCYRVNEVTD
jgi:hypothetical protein